MIRVTVTPKGDYDVFSLLTRKELDLKRKKQGTLHRHGRRKAGRVKWIHASYPGWIQLHRSIGGIAVALVQSKTQDGGNLLLSSFIGFLDRHFSTYLATINISYDVHETKQ